MQRWGGGGGGEKRRDCLLFYKFSLNTHTLFICLSPLSNTRFLSPSLSNTHTLSLSLSLSLTHTHTLSLSLTHTLSLSLSHTCRVALSLSPTHTHTHTLSLSPTLSNTHSLSLFLTHTTNTHTRTKLDRGDIQSQANNSPVSVSSYTPLPLPSQGSPVWSPPLTQHSRPGRREATGQGATCQSPASSSCRWAQGQAGPEPSLCGLPLPSPCPSSPPPPPARSAQSERWRAPPLPGAVTRDVVKTTCWAATATGLHTAFSPPILFYQSDGGFPRAVTRDVVKTMCHATTTGLYPPPPPTSALAKWWMFSSGCDQRCSK